MQEKTDIYAALLIVTVLSLLLACSMMGTMLAGTYLGVL